MIRFAALLIAFAPVAVQAQPSDSVTRTVSYGDLNLSTPEGQAALQTRLRLAAAEVCREVDPTIRGQDALPDCIYETMHNARAQVAQAIASAKGAPVMVAAR